MKYVIKMITYGLLLRAVHKVVYKITFRKHQFNLYIFYFSGFYFYFSDININEQTREAPKASPSPRA